MKWQDAMACSMASLGLTLAACSTLGADGLDSPPPPNSGAGPFRPVAAEELGTDTRAVIVVPGASVQSAMAAAGHLFYAITPAGAIHRSAPAALPPYEPGPPVLEATEPWEGEHVRDPWPVALPDGTLRLYYAAEGGIGLAEAPTPDAVPNRIGDGPLLGPDGNVAEGAIPRRPSVVEREGGGFLMYYEVGGHIALAQSDDGRDFTPEGLVDLAPDSELEPPEVALGAPGADVVVTAVGRRVTRLYFRSEREDGSRTLGFAASLDGFAFERAAFPPLAMDEPDFPAPRELALGITLLLHTVALDPEAEPSARVPVAAIAPGGADFPPE